MTTRTKETLVDAGRELAQSLLTSAVKDSADSEQMSNQIFVLKVAAVSILAHEAYNQAEQLQIPFGQYLMETVKALSTEYEILCAATDMELAEVGSAHVPSSGH